MTFPIFHVDAITDRPFAGNSAAVCILPGPRDDAWLQAVAGEMNLAETAFLTKEADGFRLRWFTPKLEVALCGHATLASAHVLWQEGLARPYETICFHTQSGVLTASQKGEEIELDFPVDPDESIDPPANLVKALGVPLSLPRRQGSQRDKGRVACIARFIPASPWQTMLLAHPRRT